MSTIDVSMEPMLEMFLYETNTLLEQLDGIMLESEKDHHLSSDSINEIFRIMHTIKGSAAMMGLDGISGLAHKVEDLFFVVRENGDKIKAHDDLFDVVFQASDGLRSAVDNISSDNPDPDFTELYAKLVKIKEGLEREVRGEPAPAPTNRESAAAEMHTDEPPQKEIPAAADNSGSELKTMRVIFEDNCQMENIRAFMLVTQLADLCTYIETIPAEPEKDSSCSSVIVRDGFIVKFKTNNPIEDIVSIMESSLNTKSYEFIDEEQHDEKSLAKDEAEAAVQAAIKEAKDTPAAAAAAIKNAPGKQSLISVNQTKLDQLMDIMGEIVIAESMVSGNPDLKGMILDNFSKSTRQLRKLTDELQDIVMSMRMIPLSGTFQKMQRIVRDMSKKLGKDAELVTEGGETEIDKTIIDNITDPFMHMVRNSMDHAIESPEERIAAGKNPQGTITMSAQNIGGEIVIIISDDGAGLNAEKIMEKAKKNDILTKPESEYTEKEIQSLIMLPGFSTNENVTEFSGRGVGMDVVRKNIEKVGGTISLESKVGVGTSFTIKIPLTLAIVDGMEIAVGNTVFTMPITSIKQS
ncbi:MAG: chemotaxis protein CheA, partial [Oscillospiraceae bacterium]